MAIVWVKTTYRCGGQVLHFFFKDKLSREQYSDDQRLCSCAVIVACLGLDRLIFNSISHLVHFKEEEFETKR